jgi:hypothetical protein
MEINIVIKNKIAQSPTESIICGNSGYTIRFSFDSEWDGYDVKTARFIFNGTFVDVVFEGDTVNVPVLRNTTMCAVGVFAGDLQTTTPALLTCKKSILCERGLPADPTPDVYAQIIELINNSGLPASTDKDFGKLLYIDKNGKCALLTLGKGLKIESGVLMLSGTVPPETEESETIAVLGISTLGKMILGKGA